MLTRAHHAPRPAYCMHCYLLYTVVYALYTVGRGHVSAWRQCLLYALLPASHWHQPPACCACRRRRAADMHCGHTVTGCAHTVTGWAHTVTGWAHTPSSVSPALNMRTHERSALCSRRTSDGCPNTVPDRWLTSLCDAANRARLGSQGPGKAGRGGRCGEEGARVHPVLPRHWCCSYRPWSKALTPCAANA